MKTSEWVALICTATMGLVLGATLTLLATDQPKVEIQPSKTEFNISTETIHLFYSGTSDWFLLKEK